VGGEASVVGFSSEETESGAAAAAAGFASASVSDALFWPSAPIAANTSFCESSAITRLITSAITVRTSSCWRTSAKWRTYARA
jgi:hypothetical protein